MQSEAGNQGTILSVIYAASTGWLCCALCRQLTLLCSTQLKTNRFFMHDVRSHEHYTQFLLER